MSFFQHIDGVTLINLEQRSAQWHSWRNGDDLPDRKARVTATMAAIIDGHSVTGKSVTRLWMELTGRTRPDPVSPFLARLFKHGETTEPIARARYIERTGIQVRDICTQHPLHPWAGSSLDGLSPEGHVITEIKCPVSQQVHNLAKGGTIPIYYRPQCRWQYFTTPSARELHYVSYFPGDEDGKDLAIIRMLRDNQAEAALLAKCMAFRRQLVMDRSVHSVAWDDAARSYRAAEAAKRGAELRMAAALEVLMKELPTGAKLHEGAGVRLSTYTRVEVDYSEVLRQCGIDAVVASSALEASRAPGQVLPEVLRQKLGLDSATFDTAVARVRESADAELRRTGNVSTRVTVSNPDPAKVVPATASATMQASRLPANRVIAFPARPATAALVPIVPTLPLRISQARSS